MLNQKAKENKMPKLYHHVNRFVVRRHVSTKAAQAIKWALTLNPGDLINDCTGYNVVVRDVEPEIVQTGRGWYIYDVLFSTEPFGGNCSLRNCGVVPPMSREQIEKEHLSYMEWYINSGKLAKWHKNDEAGYQKSYQTMMAKIELLKSGGHICDERGIILEEFRS